MDDLQYNAGRVLGKLHARTQTKNEVCYLELSSKRNELLTALFESSVISTLMLEMTCNQGYRILRFFQNMFFHEIDIDLLGLLREKNNLDMKYLLQGTHFEYYSYRPSIKYIFLCASPEGEEVDLRGKDLQDTNHL
ncbi:hypothetical protein ACJIZ3_011906 [Penstemon smallii]|uniref:Uncharacterized protein n=1 Tax=Penstemon smallii TaxID=265156 RepID=A0ABD3UKG7_9LAMI